MEKMHRYDTSSFAEYATSYITRFKEAIDSVDMNELEQVMKILEKARSSGKQIFIIGNGGSASTSSHFSTDLGKGASMGKETRFRVTSLTDNVAIITAYANDVDYESIFSEQLKNFLNEGDVVIALSASGNSPNVVKAIEYGNSVGAVTVSFVGFSGGKLKEISNHSVHVKNDDYGQTEDVHSMIQHILCTYFRDRT